MAVYQRRLGYDSDVIVRPRFTHHVVLYPEFKELEVKFKVPSKNSLIRKIYESFPFKLRIYLKEKYRSIYFYLKVIWTSRKYDVIHIHSLYLLWFLLPFKKRIVEFHGDDIRKTPSFKTGLRRVRASLFRFFFSHFTKPYVSTPDLLRELPNAEWIHNPVDIELFKPRIEFNKNTAVTSLSWYEDITRAEEICKNRSLTLTIIDRKNQKWIPYPDMPKFLSQFEFYIERSKIPSLSKTALECLALGLKVIDHEGKTIEGLDPEHFPENVAKNTIRIYEGL